MPVTPLNHYFLRASDLERSRSSKCDVPGLDVMTRPDFAFPGDWLGVGGRVRAQVRSRTLGVPAEYEAHSSTIPGTVPACATDNAANIEHIAFRATDPTAFLGALRGHWPDGTEARSGGVPTRPAFREGPGWCDDRTQLPRRQAPGIMGC